MDETTRRVREIEEQRGGGIVYRFELADGGVIERRFLYGDKLPDMAAPPSWLLNPLRSWPDPQGPMTFTGEIAQGHEDDARTALGLVL
jgi:hypothetical protein